MPSIKLTKTAVETAKPERRDYELRDTLTPGFLCKVTPAGRKVFMLTYRTPTGERRKPSLGTFGQLTVDQARRLAQDYLAAVRGGADPSQERQAARDAPTVKDLSERFLVEHSEARNKPSTVYGNRMNLRVHVLPALGRTKVADVKRPDVAALIGRLRDTPTAANHTLALLRKMFNLAELWGLRPGRHQSVSPHPEIRGGEAHAPDYRRGADPALRLSRPSRRRRAGAPDPDARDPAPIRVRRAHVGGAGVAVGVDRPRQPAGGLAGQQDRRHV